MAYHVPHTGPKPEPKGGYNPYTESRGELSMIVGMNNEESKVGTIFEV